MSDKRNWNRVHYPLWLDDPLPPERKVVLVWCEGKESQRSALPYCGYLRYAAGDKKSPYFVVYHGNSDRPYDVIAWCDCLPEKGPAWVDAKIYDKGQSQ